MARLIDADNVISVCEILSEKGNNPHYWGQLISIIEDMPAINAIPVEWLCGYLNKIGMEPVDISEMILMWKKEQEANHEHPDTPEDQS